MLRTGHYGIGEVYMQSGSRSVEQSEIPYILATFTIKLTWNCILYTLDYVQRIDRTRWDSVEDVDQY